MESKQPSLFPEGQPQPQETEVDTEAIAASARGPAEPRPSEAWLDLGGGAREVDRSGRITAPEGSPLTRHRVPNAEKPKLEDQRDDAAWREQRGDMTGSVPTSSLTSAEKNARGRAFEDAHKDRTAHERQIVDPNL